MLFGRESEIENTVSVVLRQHGWRIEMHAVGGSGDERRSYFPSCRSESAQEQTISIISRIIVRVSTGYT
jgi:hypothetical protein